jgi:hypothetical protein
MKRLCTLFSGLVVLSFWFNVASAQVQDTTRPTVISIEVPDRPQKVAFNIEITFSETVYDFGREDLSLSTDYYTTIPEGDPPTSGTVFSMTIVPKANKTGSVKFTVPANVVLDGAGNGNIAFQSESVLIDTRSPIPLLKAPGDEYLVGTYTGPFDVVIDFGEEVIGFSPDEFVVESASFDIQVTKTWIASNLSSTFPATIIPRRRAGSALSQGDIVFSVAANVAQDEAGNKNVASRRHVHVFFEDKVDELRPSVKKFTVPTTAQPGAFEVEIEFTEPVLGFGSPSVDLSWSPTDAYNPNNKPTSRVTITDWTAHSGRKRYTFTVSSSSTLPGRVYIQVPENAVSDEAGHGNHRSITKSVTVNPPMVSDTTAPTVTISTPSGPQSSPFDVTVDFSEIVTGFMQRELSVSGAGASITKWTIVTDGREYKAQITPTRDGMVRLNVFANVAQDQAGNGNSAASEQTVEVDVPDITVSISAPASAHNEPFNVTVRFSQAVTGFEQANLSVSGTVAPAVAEITALSGSGRTYTATIAPRRAGSSAFPLWGGHDIELKVNANSAGGNSASPTVRVAIWPENVNPFDDTINGIDLYIVASNFGKNPLKLLLAVDVDRDGDIDLEDFRRVLDRFGERVTLTTNAAAAPALTPHERLQRIVEIDDTDPTWQLVIQLAKEYAAELGLEKRLVEPAPKKTALLPNYPNPFNPETWIPYRLAKAADVTVTIYATNGQVVRTLVVGHQPVGSYLNRARAAYWDGKNAHGESVASGIYFYTLTAGDFRATRKMLITK